MTIARLAPAAARAHTDWTWVDVREGWEREVAHLGGLWVPMGALPGPLLELPRETPLVVYCHHGVRSLAACRYLEGLGFTALANLEGGIDAWSCELDANIPRY